MQINYLSIEKLIDKLIDYRGKTPPKTNSGVRLITAKVIKQGRILDDKKEFIAEDYYDTWMRRGLPKKWDILITTEAPMGEVAQLRSNKKVALAQRVILLRGKSHLIDQQYFFQSFKSPIVQARLKARATGTTVLGIKQSELRKVEIPVLSLPNQQKIASILSAYDDLMENNTRRIAILEEMAQRIYKEWFVDFKYPGHENDKLVDSELGMIPEGWESTSFDKLISFSIGGDWGKEEPDEIYNQPVIVIRGTDLKDVKKGSSVRSPVRFIKESSLKRRQLQVGDIVVENSVNANSRCIGSTLLITDEILERMGNKAICASFCKLYRPIDQILSPLIYLHMKYLFNTGRLHFYNNIAANGIGNFQSKRFLENEIMLMPIDKALLLNIIQNIAALTTTLYAGKINKLRQTRDYLLPKLISGQVDVSELNIDVGES